MLERAIAKADLSSVCLSVQGRSQRAKEGVPVAKSECPRRFWRCTLTRAPTVAIWTFSFRLQLPG